MPARSQLKSPRRSPKRPPGRALTTKTRTSSPFGPASPASSPSSSPSSASPEPQLAAFIAKFTPEVAALIEAVRTKLRRRLPHAHEMVYDNYNFLVIGYAPGERASEAVFSIAAYARGVTFCFLHGSKIPDPKKLLRGSGNQVRNIRLPDAATLDRPDVQALIDSAIALAPVPFDATARPRLLIKSISAKQRPRRPTPLPSQKSKIINRRS